jgi:hypothetical protein
MNEKALGEALISLIPLLREHAPEGWKDFRDGYPSDLRGGLFCRVDNGATLVPTVENLEGSRALRLKAFFGGLLTAQIARQQVAALLGDPPGLLIGGARIEESGKWWKLTFELDIESVDEITSALQPQSRPWPRS